MNYQTRITRLTIAPQGEPTFSESATHLEIDDEAAGEYVLIKQQLENVDGDTNQTIFIEPDMWPAFRDAIDTLMAEIAKNDKP